MKPSILRIVLFFAFAFLAILIPNGIGWLIKSAYPTALSQAFDHHLAGILIGIGVYTLLYGFFLFRIGSWAARIFPSASHVPISEELLKKRLFEINQLDLPFHIREGKKGMLIAEWKIADAKWATILEQGGLKILHQIYLKLDPQEFKVRVQDREKRISWSHGLGATGFSFSFFRGINFFQYERGAALGLFYQEGKWSVSPVYNYRFLLSEMKNPIIEVITHSGWIFSPVVTFFRVLGG